MILNFDKFNHFVNNHVIPFCQLKKEKNHCRHKLPAHINHHHELMDGADFRYLDGRPTPYGVRQYQRMLEQQALAVNASIFRNYKISVNS